MYRIVIVLAFFPFSLLPMKQPRDTIDFPKFTKKHKQSFCLLHLPQELICHIVSHSSNSIEQSIKNILTLSATCHQLHTIPLTKFGKMLQSYELQDKNSALRKILFQVNDYTYPTVRHALLLLVYSGARHNEIYLQYPLIMRAVDYDDTDMAIQLFQYQANANLMCGIIQNPIFFSIKSEKMLAVFIDNKVDLHASGEYGPNVLWWCMQCKKNMLAVYLKHNIDPRKTNTNGDCLLHNIAYRISSGMLFEDHISAIELLLTTISDMVNHLNALEQTSLDIIRTWKPDVDSASMQIRKKSIIQLFIDKGAKTAAELKKN